MQAFMGAESRPSSDQSNNTARKLSVAQDDDEACYQPRRTSTMVDWDEDHPLIIKFPKAMGASSTDANMEENTEMHFISKA